MDTERITTVSRDRHGIVATVRTHTVHTDRPTDLGGQDRGLMASEHLLVALASCTSTTALKVAEKRRVPLDDVEIAAEMDFNDAGEATAIRLNITARADASEPDVVRVFDLAERVCTISKLLALKPERVVRVTAPADADRHP